MNLMDGGQNGRVGAAELHRVGDRDEAAALGERITCGATSRTRNKDKQALGALILAHVSWASNLGSTPIFYFPLSHIMVQGGAKNSTH